MELDNNEQELSYKELLHEISKQWLLLELKHRTSKAASDDFWALAKTLFPKVYRAKIEEMVHKSIPSFTFQRLKLYKSTLPKIDMEIGYENRETNEVTVVEAERTPVSRFNPRQYKKIYEAASVKVI